MAGKSIVFLYLLLCVCVTSAEDHQMSPPESFNLPSRGHACMVVRGKPVFGPPGRELPNQTSSLELPS